MLPLKFHLHRKLKKDEFGGSHPGLGERAKIKFPFATHFCRCVFYDEARKKQQCPSRRVALQNSNGGLLAPQGDGLFHFTNVMEELIQLKIST